MNDLFVTYPEDGLTALEVLIRHVPAAPAAYLRQLLRQSKVSRLGEALAESTVVRTGDRLLLPDSGRLAALLRESQNLRIEILLEASQWLVVCKPAGLAVHRGVGHETDNLADRVQRWLAGQGAPFRASPVHRLDVGTSGPVLFAKGRKAAGELGRVFMEGRVEKTYLALAAGQLPDSGVLDSPVPAKGTLKKAATRFRVLERNPAFVLLELELLSGRTHQIRRQLADAGHPLAGDRRYGGPHLPGLERPFLHCRKLAWLDPSSDSPIMVEAPLPEALLAVLTGQGISFQEAAGCRTAKIPGMAQGSPRQENRQRRAPGTAPDADPE